MDNYHNQKNQQETAGDLFESFRSFSSINSGPKLGYDAVNRGKFEPRQTFDTSDIDAALSYDNSRITGNERMKHSSKTAGESSVGSNQRVWDGLQQIHSPEGHAIDSIDQSEYDSKASDVSTVYTPITTTDSLTHRQERFQSGLQDLSDKLRIGQPDFGGPTRLSSGVRDYNGTVEPQDVPELQQDTWAQVQALLKSKLDEVSFADEFCGPFAKFFLSP